MKLLLYCTKAKPYLQINRCVLPTEYDRYILSKEQYYSAFGEPLDKLNGKIVAECDFEVEDLRIVDDDPLGAYWYETKTLCENEVLEKSCLTDDELYEYLGEDNEGYAIHIKNLHIFDKPKELSEYSKRIGRGDFQVLGNAPQNMMKCCEIKYMVKDYILISIRPQWLCKILNGEKTIEVRKKVLKEMMKYY
jgi:predicted transcriptional regulator